MSAMCPLLALLAAGYGAALLASLAASVLQAVLYKHRLPTSAEARALALLPLAALLLTLWMPHPTLWEPLHLSLHGWMECISASEPLHQSLHVANLVFALFLVTRLVPAVYLLARSSALEKALLQAAGPPVGGIHRLPTAAPHYFTFGSLRPRIFASTGMLAALTPMEQAAAQAHEEAHCRRKDGLWQLLLALLYCLLPLPGAARLQAEARDAAERACDRDAAQKLGSACDVAEALLGVSARLAAPPTTALALSFGDGPASVERRVRCLLAPERVGALPGFWILALLALTLIVLVMPLLHHAAELFAFHG
jgi:Zn-dependent protease with chaperone function